jgi:hypothetical protein
VKQSQTIGHPVKLEDKGVVEFEDVRKVNEDGA